MVKKYEHLLEQGNIGKMKLKNRMIFPPVESVLGTINGEVTQRVIDYYVRRAEGGASLAVVHAAQACSKLDPFDPATHSLRVDDVTYIPMLAKLAESVHLAGAKIALLVSPGAGAQAYGSLYDRGCEGIKEVEHVGATEKESGVTRKKVRRLSIEEIEKIVEAFGLAAGRVKSAGFDALWIHAWGGYLVGQFLSPYFNTRDDKYGRDFEGRLRFLLEIIKSSRKYVGPDFPLIVRLSIDEGVPGGLGPGETTKIAKRLEQAGVNAIDAVAGIYETLHLMMPPVYMPKGCLLDLAAAVKKAVKIPIITGGKLYEPDMAEDAIRQGKADFVTLGRGMLADPDWANKVIAGKPNEIRKCISCNCCIGAVFNNQIIRCTINPTLGREHDYPEVPAKAAVSKKVVIVGAGPGGMEAARIAALRGHKVKLFEKTGKLGGQVILAAKPMRDEYLNFIEYEKSQFKKLDNLEVVLDKEATVTDVMKENPDIVILATGGVPLLPQSIEGMKGENVVSAWDILAGKAKVSGKVVVAGGGLVGVETADYLAERGASVTVVEMLDDVATDEEIITKLVLLDRLKQSGVTILTGHKIEKITKGGVITVDKDNKKTTVAADYVVAAFGTKSYNPLEEKLRARVKECYVIGDAKEPARIRNAVLEGFMVGQKV